MGFKAGQWKCKVNPYLMRNGQTGSNKLLFKWELL